jgi:hypothetical protein
MFLNTPEMVLLLLYMYNCVLCAFLYLVLAYNQILAPVKHLNKLIELNHSTRTVFLAGCF